MPKLILFYLKNCPYCVKAFKYLQQLQTETPAFADIEIQLVEEKQQAALANSYNYYYVPTFYLGDKKLHEGAASKSDIEKVLQQAAKQA